MVPLWLCGISSGPEGKVVLSPVHGGHETQGPEMTEEEMTGICKDTPFRGTLVLVVKWKLRT